MNDKSSSAPSQPPDNIARRFRAVHKRALTFGAKNLTPVYRAYGVKGVAYGVDSRYISADTVLPEKADCYIFDPKNVVQEFNQWSA